ncbi:MAG TPA: hypothetical protein VF892_18810 [Pseudonocardiaceae bacterium]
MIRIGILALPLGNAFKLVGNLGTFNSVGYGIPAATEADIAAGPGYFLGNLFGSILPVLLGILGMFALFGYLAGRADRRTIVSALVCAVLGAGITLAALGVVTYAIPALAHAYQAGDTAAMTVANRFFTWPWGAIFYPAVLFPIGLILFCTALWRSTTISRTAIVLAGFSGVLIAIPVPIHSIRLAGGVLGLAAGAWLAIAIRRDLARSPR